MDWGAIELQLRATERGSEFSRSLNHVPRIMLKCGNEQTPGLEWFYPKLINEGKRAIK